MASDATRERREGANGETKRSCARAHCCRCGHVARAVTSRRAWVARILTQHVEDVAKVEADGANTQLDLAGAKRIIELWLLDNCKRRDGAASIVPRA